MKQYYYYYTPLMDPCRNPANDVIRKPFKMTVIKGPHFFRSMQILFGVENEFCASCRVPYVGVLKTRDPCPAYVGLYLKFINRTLSPSVIAVLRTRVPIEEGNLT